VKSHPWWPGVIINPSDGSNLAMKYQKKDTFLVAYFGDKTFAWCDESQLKPFFPNFSHFEKQASSDAYSNAVRSVLVEVYRRFEVGTICSCLDEKQFAKEIYPKLENAGVRQGFVNCAVDRYKMVKYFNPKGLVDFIKDLALVPTKVTTDKLELVMVTSQLKAFYRMKGYSLYPKYQTFGPLEDYIEPVIISTKREELPENTVMKIQTPPAVTPPSVAPSVNYAPEELGFVAEKPKKKRGRPPKKKKEELDIEVEKPLSELVIKKVHSNLSNGSQSNSKPEKTTTDEEDSVSPLPWKKRKEVGFDLVEHENQVQTPRSSGFGISFKIGECISRAASRLTGSGSGPSPLISMPKFDSADFDVSSDDETPMPATNEEKRVRKRRLKKYHYSDPKDVLSQLCLAATGPKKEYAFFSTVVSYFTDFRNFIVEPPPSTETGFLPEKVKLRRGQKRKVELPLIPSDEVVTLTDHMQDSYWSDMILCGQTEEPSSGPKQRRRRVSIETKHLKLTPGGPDAKRALAVAAAATKRPIIRVEEKRLDECNPTALLLTFGTRYGTVPSEMDIVRIFSQYGPLKEWEMEKMDGSTNRVWIVFKRRADAEMAFSNLRKQNVFGPSLLSYRLVYEMDEKGEQDKKIKVPNGGQHFELKGEPNLNFIVTQFNEMCWLNVYGWRGI
jgi:PWWP domain